MRTQNHLAVRANIQEKGEFVGVIHARRQDTRGDICAHIAGYSRQTIDRRLRVQAQTHIASIQEGYLINSSDKRRQPDRRRRYPKQQVNHGAVTGDGSFDNIHGLYLHALAGCLDQFVDRIQHQVAKFLGAIFFAGIDDARNDIFAARNLAVIFRHLRFHLSIQQVYQPH